MSALEKKIIDKVKIASNKNEKEQTNLYFTRHRTTP